MARREHREQKYEAAALWRRRCLKEPGSLFRDQSIWAGDPLDVLEEHFIGQPIEGTDLDFMEKLEVQLEDAEAAGIKLAAEMLWVMHFALSRLTVEKKRSYVTKVWSWSGEKLDEDHELLDEDLLVEGIGNPGQGYAAYRHREFALFIRTMQAWRALDDEQRGELLESPWQFADWFDEIEGARRRQLRHLLLHLLFPESFEWILTKGDKSAVVSAFDSFLPEDISPEKTESDLVALDRNLLTIRQELADELDADRLDFYSSPLEEAWHSPSGQDQSLDALEALRQRGQIVLYGPPGTSKTHDALDLARRAIRAEALRRWEGAYFTVDDERWDDVLDEHVVRRQLHPAYSYEDFVVGLRINEEGGTEYEDGLLLRLTDRIERAREEDERFGDLPFVLVLDEINRADLARLFGEAFSALEDRGEEIEVPAPGRSQEDEHSRTLRLPENLFVIGTMNLIDQSLEQIDFALRRRFAWFPYEFSEEALLEVAESRWDALVAERTDLREDSWEQILPEMERLQAAARRLNDAIESYEYLGPQYVIGHTYFSETLPMVADVAEKSTRAKKYFLWSSNSPLPPLEALWNHHIKPLLEQYLAGLETSQREERLDEWETLFLERPDVLDA